MIGIDLLIQPLIVSVDTLLWLCWSLEWAAAIFLILALGCFPLCISVLTFRKVRENLGLTR